MYKYTIATGAHTELMWEADLSPTGTGSPYNQPSSFETDINDNGTWIIACDDDSSTLTDHFIQVTDSMGNVSVFVQDGQPVPGIDPMLGFNIRTSTFGAVQISDNNEITWFCDWDDPDTTRDTDLFRNNILLWQEGVSLTALGETARTIDTAVDAMGVSDNGRYIIKELNVEPIGGDPSTTFDDLTGAYMFDLGLAMFDSFCNGDGGDQMGCTDCPCGNNASAGTVGGCLNSAGTSAALIPSGLPAVGNDTLHFNVTGASVSTFGILQSADNNLPNMGACAPGSGIVSPVLDGLRCVGGSALRHGTRATNANGDIGLTNNGWGTPNGPMGGLIANGGFVAGQTRHFQCFYRENPTGGCLTGQNTTNAVTVMFQ